MAPELIKDGVKKETTLDLFQICPEESEELRLSAFFRLDPLQWDNAHLNIPLNLIVILLP